MLTRHISSAEILVLRRALENAELHILECKLLTGDA